MAYIEISELTETLQVDNDSVFPVVYQGATRKIKFSSFKQMLNYFTAVSYNKTTGVFTFTKVDGTSATLTSDLQLSFKDVSFDSSTGIITFTKQSGETKTLDCNGKRFITANEITKLSGIEAGAQVNVIETVKVNGEALTPDANKAVDIDLSNRDEEISNLKTKNELLVKDHVPIENTGTELQLTGTGDLPMELVPYGNNSQETTSIAGGDEYDSPSIEHESPVKVVDGEYEFQIQNENLLDLGEKNISLNGVNSVIKHSKIVLNGTTNSASNVIDGTRVDIFYPKGNYVLKCNKLNTISNADYVIYLSFYYKDGTREQKSFATNEALSLKYLNFTDDIDHVAYYIYCNRSGAVFNNVEIEFQLVKGTNAPQQYIEAKTQFQSIDTLSNPLYSENDYYKYLTSEQATALGLNTGEGWYVYNEWGIEIANGTTKKFIYRFTKKDNKGFFQYSLNKSRAYSDGYLNAIKSNYLKAVSSVQGAYQTFLDYDEGIWWEGNTDLIYCILPVTTLEEANAILTNLYNNQTPLYFIYKLRNATYTKITDTDLINSLEALKDMQSYYDVTNISQTHNTSQADMKIQANALKSLKAMQSEIDELKQAVLNS